jgi:hypothetical protein
VAPGRSRVPLIALVLVTVAFGASTLLVVGSARPGALAVALVLVAGAAVGAIVGIWSRRIGIAGLAAGLLGAAFVVSQLGQAPAMATAAGYGALLFACFELTTLAIAKRSVVPYDEAARRQQRRQSGVAIASALLTASIVAVAATAGRGAGIMLFVVAAVAATSVLTLVAQLGARASRD